MDDKAPATPVARPTPVDEFHSELVRPAVRKQNLHARGLSQAEISRAISFARIVLIVGLVFLHYDTFINSTASPFDGLDIHNHQVTTWIVSTLLFFFYSVVPLLSMVSGWLFFSFKPADAWTAIKRRISRRFVSLYMPLVVWNIFYLAVIYVFFLNHPNHAFFSNLEYTFPLTGIKDYINAIFGITHRPIGFQFWFVRDLFVTALVSPVFWLMIRYAPWPGALLLCLGWLANKHFGIFFRLDVPFFFYMGALVHQKNYNLTVPLRLAIALTAIYVVMAGARALAPYAIDFTTHDPHRVLNVATRLMRLVGVIGCWGLMYRMAQTDWGKHIGQYGGVAFFLHSAHWPLLVALKLALWPLLPTDNDFWMLIHYLATVTLTVTIGLGLGVLLARKLPSVFALMNGGRELGQTSG